MSLLYSPAEDSYLLKDVLLKNLKEKQLKILEVGVGSGFILENLRQEGYLNLFGVDINKEAVKNCKEKKLNVWESNLFSKIKERYDIILFNPPYLPKNKSEDFESSLVTTGGLKGGELINKFLIKSKNHLKKKGKIYLLVSSLSGGINLKSLKIRLVGEKKLFFEKLKVFEIIF